MSKWPHVAYSTKLTSSKLHPREEVKDRSSKKYTFNKYSDCNAKSWVNSLKDDDESNYFNLLPESAHIVVHIMELSVGRQFTSFADIQVLLDIRHQVFGETWLIGGGSRRIEVSNSYIKDSSKHYRRSFKYSFINYRCINEGTYVSRQQTNQKVRK